MYLPLMRGAVHRNDALAVNLALLEDRVRVGDGQPPLYDSELTGSPPHFDPIDDAAHVDERRRAIGLEPLAGYAKHFRVTYVAPARTPE